jgi:hypothetical protein
MSHNLPTVLLSIAGAYTLNCTVSSDDSVGIAKDYGLDGRGSIPGRGKRFSLLQGVQTGCGAYTAS